MSNFWQRTITGILFVAVIIFAVFAPFWVTVLIFSAFAALTTYEFHKLTNKQDGVDVNPIIPAIASAVLSLQVFISTLYYSETHMSMEHTYALGGAFVLIYFVFFLYVLIFELFRNKANPINNIAYTILGQIYIAWPFSLILLIGGAGIWQLEIFMLALFVLIWANDTFAYLIGVSFGKHKMFERISPKKSWEGFVGGLVGALAVAFVFSYFTETHLSTAAWFGFAMLVVIFGTLGDLLESLMKRTIGVKDSGNILPGHGGLLDRFDSLLLAAPIIYIYMQLF